MKHGHPCHTSNELEIREVILVAQARVGIDLECVVVPAETRAEREKVINRLNVQQIADGATVGSCCC